MEKRFVKGGAHYVLWILLPFLVQHLVALIEVSGC